MRVIFLDIDGVLNSHRTAVAYQAILQRKLDPVAVAMLHRVVKQADAAIVISSTWRQCDGWKELVWGCLREAGWPWESYGFLPLDECPIIDRTPLQIPQEKNHPRRQRGCQIAVWLEEHPEYDDYIIIDDDSDMTPEQCKSGRFINVDHKTGLSFDNFMQIKEIWPEVDKIDRIGKDE